MRRKFNKIIIHHSAGDDNKEANWGDIKRWHRIHNLWKDIGYHAGIERVGRDIYVMMGRSWRQAGAHCAGFNSRGFGFCFVGNYTHKPPDGEMMRVAVRFLRDVMDIYEISVEDVVGHREVKEGKTECPGKAFDMEDLRGRLREMEEEG